jgi:hypothetical protein
MAPRPAVCPKKSVRKRAIPRPGQVFATFWADEVAAAETNVLNWRQLQGTHSISTSATSVFGNYPFTFWTDGQIGCTTVWVFAKHGFWVGHFFETTAMGDGRGGEQPLAVFNVEVIDFINNGNPGMFAG